MVRRAAQKTSRALTHCNHVSQKRSHQRQTLLVPGARLPLEPFEELLVIRTGARFKLAGSLGRSSPVTAIVVRLVAPFMMGVVRGLSTLFFQSASWLLLTTMRRAALAENIEFSFGGLHAVAVGLRRRWARLTGTEPWFVEERRLMADPILRASELVHFSSSELEFPLFSAGIESAFSTILNDEVRTLLPISRSGDALSESEENAAIVGGAGEPLDPLDRAPNANRFERLRSTEGLGGVGIGEDPS